jgi:hypothetical protein
MENINKDNHDYRIMKNGKEFSKIGLIVCNCIRSGLRCQIFQARISAESWRDAFPGFSSSGD